MKFLAATFPGIEGRKSAICLPKFHRVFRLARICTKIHGLFLSGSHRSTHIASDLASRALASQAKPQRESESQAFRIARS